jgi:DNA repair exonuclease SbcCD nuclease subunit
VVAISEIYPIIKFYSFFTPNPNPMISSSRRQFLVGFAALFPILNTYATKKKTIRFDVASDGHFGQLKTDSDLNYKQLVESLNTEKANLGLDLAIFNGDLFHDDITVLPQVKNHLDQLTLPYYATRGNHDHASAQLWQQTWGFGLNHVVSQGQFSFVLADTSNEQGHYLCPDFTWLDQELAKLTKQKAVFMFLHIPSKLWTPHGTDCTELASLLKKYTNVRAVFHGHDHSIDTAKASEGTNFLFDGHFGGNWGTQYRGYRIVEVTKKGFYTYQFDLESKTKVNEFRF